MRYPDKKTNLSLKELEEKDHDQVYISGRNPDVDQATDPEDLIFSGGAWSPPTQPRIHQITSDTSLDIGSDIHNGVATSGGDRFLHDLNSNFISLSASVGDLLLNETTGQYSPIILVDTNTLECEITSQKPFFVTGDLYRIVSPSGAGASVVCIEYIDENLNEKTGFYVLNGLTQIPTPPMIRINNFFVCGASDRQVLNVGLISLFAMVDGSTSGEIIPNEGVSSFAAYTVPKGKAAYLTQASASLAEKTNAGASVSLKSIEHGLSGTSGGKTVRLFDLSATGTNYGGITFNPPLRFDELTDLVMRCTSVSSNNVDITGRFGLLLVKNA